MESTKLDRLRSRCRTDLIFLAQHVLGYNRITEETHGPVARTFVQKTENVPTLEQDDVKDRLLLCPRGSFKSTLDVCDCVQWILVDPDIRILVLTGTAELARSFVGEIRSHFVVRPRTVNKLALIFPEYCIPEKEDTGDEFWCPARSRTFKEPSIMAAGIETATSGFHFDVMKCDDTVNNRNSETSTYLERTSKNVNIARKMLNPGGYHDLIGTRYSPSDHYGQVLEQACEDTGITVQDLETRLYAEPEAITLTGDFGSIKIFSKPAWRHASGRAILTPAELKVPTDFKLFFPAILSFKFLAKEYRRDQQSFFSQYLNDPSAAAGAIITADMLRAITVPPDLIPKDGQIICCWDLNYKNGQVNDHSACTVGKLCPDGKMYLLDTVYERFRPSEIGRVIALTAKRVNANQIDIEDCLGAQWMASSIGNEIADYPCSVTWIPIDRTPNSKQVRIKSIEKYISGGKLLLASNASNLTVLYDQLIRAGWIKRDDMADSLAYLCARIPVERFIRPEPLVDQMEQIRKKALYRMIYGLDAPMEAPPQEAETILPDAFDQFSDICPGLVC